MTPPPNRPVVAAGVAGLAVFFFASSMLTALVFPPLRAADEGAHVAHAYAVSGGRIPSVLDPQTGGPYQYRSDRTLYTAHHPPLFPALIGPVVRVGNRAADATAAVRAARTLSALFGTVAVIMTAALLRELAPRRPAVWIAAAGFVAATPLVAHISGLVYNDGLALAVTAGVSWIGLRILRLGPTTARTSTLAILATLAALTRISALPIAGAAILVAAIGARRSHASRSQVMGVVAAPVVAMTVGAGWFYARNLSEYGDVSGGNELYDLLERRPRSASALVEPDFVAARLSGLWTSREWERGKYGFGPVDTLVELGLVAVALVGVVLLVGRLVRRRPRADGVVVAFAAFTAASVLGGFAVHVTSGGTPHSRYLFGLLWIVGTAFAVGLAELRATVASGVLAALLSISTVISVASLDQVLRNDDLPIGPSGSMATFWTDSTALMQLSLVAVAVLVMLGASLAVWAYAALRRTDASSPTPRVPMPSGEQQGS